MKMLFTWTILETSRLRDVHARFRDIAPVNGKQVVVSLRRFHYNLDKNDEEQKMKELVKIVNCLVGLVEFKTKYLNNLQSKKAMLAERILHLDNWARRLRIEDLDELSQSLVNFNLVSCKSRPGLDGIDTVLEVSLADEADQKRTSDQHVC